MKKIYFGFAIADSMLTNVRTLTRTEIDAEQTKALLAVKDMEVVPCLNPSHVPSIKAMTERFGIEVEVPTTAPQVQLNPGDMLLVMSIRGLPRLDATRHEYTQEEVDGASFTFSQYVAY